MTVASESAIRVESLSVHYGRHLALAPVTAEFARGKVAALVGPSGCGKSSFLASLNRLTDLIPDCRVSGRVRVGELDVFGPGVDLVRLRRRVGMIFQTPNPFPLSIRDNVELGLKEHGVSDRDERSERARRALEDVGLLSEVASRLRQSALRLSGGQQQRLCLARALALEPEILLMDEPCSSLDPIATGKIEELIRGMAGRLTILVVTHNLAQARRLSDDIAVFWMQNGSGCLLERGATREVFEHPRHELTSAYVRGDCC
ncbi:MAG: phosphate ABC transporter ATP-binding protein [Planctomycetota bacterium]